MPWGKLDDSLYDHPKVEALPDSARLACIGLWAMSISYSNRHLTDGHVAASKVRKLGGSPRLIAALVAVGLFDEVSDGYVIHDFSDYNPSREETIEKRAAMRDLGKLGGIKSGEARRLNRDGSATVEPNAKRGALNSRPTPVPSRPNGSTEALGVVGASPAAVHPWDER